MVSRPFTCGLVPRLSADAVAIRMARFCADVPSFSQQRLLATDARGSCRRGNHAAWGRAAGLMHQGRLICIRHSVATQGLEHHPTGYPGWRPDPAEPENALATLPPTGRVAGPNAPVGTNTARRAATLAAAPPSATMRCLAETTPAASARHQPTHPGAWSTPTGRERRGAVRYPAWPSGYPTQAATPASPVPVHSPW